MDGVGYPLGLPRTHLYHFDAFGGLVIFLGCLLRVLSVVVLGQGDQRVLVPRFFWCDDAFVAVSSPLVVTAAFCGGLVCLVAVEVGFDCSLV